MKRIFTLLLLASTIIGNAQTTINLSPERDNTIYSSFPNNSNGAGEYFFVGRNAAANANSIQRGLLYFNLGSLPAGATITGATLNLYVDKSGPVGTGIQIHKATAAWGEGTSNAGGLEASGTPATINDATWNMRIHPNNGWSAAGGDFAATPSAVENNIPGFINGSTLISLSGTIAADVQDWADNPAGNFGWIIRSANESTSASVKRFISKESAAAASRPVLSVTYTLGTVPVTLTSFKAALKQDVAVLTWTTATEVNNKYFEVQHSGDGNKFGAIGRLNGAGNSSTEQRYSFTHANLVPGKNYYRLAQVDEDGTVKYSRVAEIAALKGERLVISPNPVANQLNIIRNTLVTSGQYSILHTNGKVVKKGMLTTAPVDVSMLKSGMYILSFHPNNDTPQTAIFYKK